MILSAKDKKQLMILAGLLFIFAIASKDSFSRVKKSQERLKKSRLVKTFAETGVVSEAMTKASVPAERAVSGGLDPFSGRPITIGMEEAVSSFKLSGILYNPSDPANSYAIINNKSYKIGDTLSNSDLKITDIFADGVTLSDGRSSRKLKTW